METRWFIMEKGWGSPPFPLAPLHPSPFPEVSAWLHMGMSQKPEASHTEKEGKSEKPSWGRRGSRSPGGPT